MDLAMNTENARVLATAFEERSDRSVALRDNLAILLARAALDDIYDVGGALTAVSDDLHTGYLVIRHQADIMDGLTVDVDALSEELGVDRWKIEKQLKGIEGGWIDPGEALISIVDWADYTVLGLDTSIREFVGDAPPLGTDAEFDDLIRRLDGWLLSLIVDGRPIVPSQLDAFRQADLQLLGERLGMPDLTTVEITETYYETRRWRTGGEDFSETTELTRTIALPTDQYQPWTIDWITDRLTSERKLSRVGTVPQIGELFDLSMKTVTYTRWEGNTDDGKDVKYTKEEQRTPQELNEAIAAQNAAFAAIGWLPAVLAGRQDPPPTLATDPVMQEMLADFASRFGYGEIDHAWAGDDPIAFLKARNVLGQALEQPRPVQKARVAFTDVALDSSIELGIQTGVVTEQTAADAKAIALHLSGLDPNVDPATVDAATLTAEAPELDIEQLVGLIAATVPPQFLTEQRLMQAITYVQRAGTVEERIGRVERALLGMTTATTVGEAAMTRSDWLNTLPSKIQRETFDTEIDGKQFQWLSEHVGVPGYHKSPDWARRGDRFFHLVNEVDGTLDDFVIEIIPKKKSWFSKWGPMIFKTAISIAVPAAGVMFAAMDAVRAAAEGDWTGAALSAVGALAAGAGAFAAANPGTFASGVANAAQAVNAGLKAGVSFARGDKLGGIINSVAAVGAGAASFGAQSVGNGLAGAANVIRGVDATIDAIEGKDLAGAIAGGLTAGSSLVNLASNVGQSSGLITESETIDQLDQWATSGQQLSKVVRTGGAVVDGIVDEEWGALAGAGLRFGAAATDFLTDDTGAVAGMISTDPEAGARTLANGERVSGWDSLETGLNSAADLADGGLALARGDELGGVALIGGGVNGLLSISELDSVHLERLDAVADITDKLADLPHDADMSAILAAAGTDMNRLAGTFRTSADDVTLRSGNPAASREQIASERQAIEDQRRRLQQFMQYTPDDALVSGVLGGIDAQLNDELVALTREQQLADGAARRELAAERARRSRRAGFALGQDRPEWSIDPQQVHLAAGHSVDGRRPLVEAVTNPNATGRELVLLVGGGGDTTFAADGERQVGDQLRQQVQQDHPDAAVGYVEWDGRDDGAEWIKQFAEANPGVNITIIGHSYGGDTAMDIAADLGPVGGEGGLDVEVVTLDPVAWSRSETPANVTNWINVPIDSGSWHPSDLIATAGGRWGPIDGALNVQAPDGVVHGNPLALYRRSRNAVDLSWAVDLGRAEELAADLATVPSGPRPLGAVTVDPGVAANQRVRDRLRSEFDDLAGQLGLSDDQVDAMLARPVAPVDGAGRHGAAIDQLVPVGLDLTRQVRAGGGVGRGADLFADGPNPASVFGDDSLTAIEGRLAWLRERALEHDFDETIDESRAVASTVARSSGRIDIDAGIDGSGGNSGSGLLLQGDDGRQFIVTNHHVAAGLRHEEAEFPPDATFTNAAGEVRPISFVASQVTAVNLQTLGDPYGDRTSDVAVYQIDGPPIDVGSRPFTVDDVMSTPTQGPARLGPLSGVGFPQGGAPAVLHTDDPAAIWQPGEVTSEIVLPLVDHAGLAGTSGSHMIDLTGPRIVAINYKGDVGDVLKGLYAQSPDGVSGGEYDFVRTVMERGRPTATPLPSPRRPDLTVTPSP